MGNLLCVVCEICKAPYAAELNEDQILTILGDDPESATSDSLRSWGYQCPLPDNLAILLGANSLSRNDQPPPNRFGLLGNIIVISRNGSLSKAAQAEIVSAVEKYDAEQMFKSFRIPSGAVSARTWKQRGNKWKPDVHLTVDLRDRSEMHFVNTLLLKYGNQMVGCYLQAPFGALQYMELQFSDTTDGRDQARSFLREFHIGGDPKGHV